MRRAALVAVRLAIIWVTAARETVGVARDVLEGGPR